MPVIKIIDTVFCLLEVGNSTHCLRPPVSYNTGRNNINAFLPMKTWYTCLLARQYYYLTFE